MKPLDFVHGQRVLSTLALLVCLHGQRVGGEVDIEAIGAAIDLRSARVYWCVHARACACEHVTVCWEYGSIRGRSLKFLRWE